MTLWHIILLLLDLVLIQLLLGIVMERRNPTATWVWLLVLIAAPVVGIPLYLIFGRTRVRQRVRHHGATSRSLRAAMPVTGEPTGAGFPQGFPTGYAQLAQLVAGLEGGPVRCGNRVDLLLDGPATFDAMVKAIEAAERFVHLEFYIYADGKVGRGIKAALEAAAARGVEVRVLCDAFGSFSLPWDYFSGLEQRGGKVAWFAPLRIMRLRRRPDFRNHRKILIADGKIGFVGGINLVDYYLAGDNPRTPWRDTNLRVCGPAVRDLEALILESWAIATGEILAAPELLHECESSGDVPVQVLGGGPDTAWPSVEKVFASGLHLARTRVDLATPYFAPSEVVHSALNSAALRGVEVRLMLPSHTDVRVADWAARSFYSEFLEAGVRIFEYHPRMLHAKTFSVDGELCIVGTANLDLRSLQLNYEAGAIVYDRDLTAAVDRSFEDDLQHCHELTMDEVDAWSRPRRLRQNLARLLAPVL